MDHCRYCGATGVEMFMVLQPHCVDIAACTRRLRDKALFAKIARIVACVNLMNEALWEAAWFAFGSVCEMEEHSLLLFVEATAKHQDTVIKREKLRVIELDGQ